MKHKFFVLCIGLVIVFIGGACQRATAFDPVYTSWRTIGDLEFRFIIPDQPKYDYYDQTITTLDDGRLLVYGNGNYPKIPSSFFDPKTFTWATGPYPIIQRDGHQSVKLPNGQVVLIGGSGYIRDLAEDDPIRVQAKKSLIARCGQSALDSENKFLNAQRFFISQMEVYSPTTNRFSLLGKLENAPFNFQAELLQSGQILILDGYSSTVNIENKIIDSNSVLIDFNQGKFLVQKLYTKEHRYQPHFVQLGDGRVLIFGGQGSTGSRSCQNSLEIFDPKKFTFDLIKIPMIIPKYGIKPIISSNDIVYFTGVNNEGVWENRKFTPKYTTFYIEIYIPTQNRFIDPLLSPKDHVAKALLFDRYLLFQNYEDSPKINKGCFGYVLLDTRTNNYSVANFEFPFPSSAYFRKIDENHFFIMGIPFPRTKSQVFFDNEHLLRLPTYNNPSTIIIEFRQKEK